MNLPVKIGAQHYGNGACSVTIENLTKEEAENLMGMLRGFNWTTVASGRLQSHPRFKPLPQPADDLEMMPYWRRAQFPLDGRLQVNLFDPERFRKNYGTSIHISSLCGYYFTPEKYQREAGKLISWGFHCMRSRRDSNGQYWETWYLPGGWSAKGELGIVVQKIRAQKAHSSEKSETDAMVNYLCNNVSFGSMDVVVQRAAMGPPE